MRAIVHDEYGPPDVLSVREIDKPVIKADQVLVRVHAAGRHVGDLLGDRVEPVGNSVTQFHPGDEVFGACRGACAEYASAGDDKLALKPTNLALEEAAAIPTSALAALHALRDAGKVEPGQRVLINGASGGVGTFAVQIAKSFGAHVTGVCGTTNVSMVRSIGADAVIDYTQEDFMQGGQTYDLILDNVENR